MKKQVLVELLVLTALLFAGLVMVSPVEAVELMKWERIPLPVALHAGQERVVFVDKNVRVGFPSALNGKLRIQSTGGAVYLYPSETFTQTRLQLQDVESGEVILLDVTATNGKGPLEPVRLVYHGDVTTLTANYQIHHGAKGDNASATSPSPAGGPDPLRRAESVCAAAYSRSCSRHSPRIIGATTPINHIVSLRAGNSFPVRGLGRG